MNPTPGTNPPPCTPRSTPEHPKALRIAKLSASPISPTPNLGDAVDIRDVKLPVFWACGVIPHAAVMASRPPFAITHAPGHIFLTDIRDTAYLISNRPATAESDRLN